MMNCSEYLERKAIQLQQRLLLIGQQVLLKEATLTLAMRKRRDSIQSQEQYASYTKEEETLKEDLCRLHEREEDLKKELLLLQHELNNSPTEQSLAVDTSSCMTESEGHTGTSSANGAMSSPSSFEVEGPMSSLNCSEADSPDEEDKNRRELFKRARWGSGADSPPQSVAESPSTEGDRSVLTINVYEAFKDVPRLSRSAPEGRATRSANNSKVLHPYDATDDREVNVDGSSLNVDSLHLLESRGWRRKKCSKILPLGKFSSTVYLPPGGSFCLPEDAVKNRDFFLTIAAAKYFADGGCNTSER